MPKEQGDILGDALTALGAVKGRGVKWVRLAPAQRAALAASPPQPGAPVPRPAARPAAPALASAAHPAVAAPPRPAPAARPAAPVKVPPAVTVTTGAEPTPRRVTDEQLAAMDHGQLAAEAANCFACRLCQGRKNTVFCDGTPEAKLLFVGEGPGEDEDIQGKPFVGKAGQLLTKMIEAMGLQRQQVYICNIVKCRPPGNRNPDPEEAAQCLPFLRRQIDIVRPQVMVLLGAVPLRFLLNLEGIMRRRGQWLEYRSIPVMPTFHPAFLLRLPNYKREVWQDLQAVMARLGLQPPRKS